MSMSSEENPGSGHENVSKVVKMATTKESQPGQKGQVKVPRRIHKAERERMKREQLNDLFDSLANVLELSDETNGKASVLNEAAKFVKDMFTQVESLRRENEALSLESQYVDMEKQELLDETASLESQIVELQKELKDRAAEAVPPVLDLNTSPLDFQHQELAMQQAMMQQAMQQAMMQQATNLKPVYVIPLCSEPVFQPPGPATTVSKPQPRYPTPADKWPSQLLEKHLQ